MGFLEGLQASIGRLNDYKECKEKAFVRDLMNRIKYPDEAILHNMRNSKNEWTRSVCREEAERRGLI